MLTDAYTLNKDCGVWLPKEGGERIAFTDGSEIEEKLTNILNLATDRSASSQELLDAAVDWPLAYHLSPYRSNLLRPLEEYLKGSVLELGAGCGGVSRYIGEVSSRHVAVEGSLSRAKICAQRCAGLGNVSVVCDRIENLKISEKFSVVTLIGVLEYARAFAKDQSIKDPIVALLEKCREFLAPGGVLLIAIENQLGLKYFAGAKEDHLSKEWVGVSDLYTDDSAVTFGKKELTTILSSVGFRESRFWLPLPDYKLPVSVVDGDSLEAASRANVDLSPFFAQSVGCDMNQPETPVFSLEAAWNVVSRNGLLEDLANSFLVMARLDPEDKVSLPNKLVFHYGVSRRKEFQKVTTVEVQQESLATVRRRALYTDGQSVDRSRYSIEWSDEEYVNGESFISSLFKIVNREGWTIESIADWARPWIELLKASVVRESGKIRSGPCFNRLPNNYLDATPFNLIRLPSGDFKFFDLEWLDQDGPLLGHVVVRGILGSLDRISSVAPPLVVDSLNYLHLIKQLLNALGLPLDAEDIDQILVEESNFRSWVTGFETQLRQSQLQMSQLKLRDLPAIFTIPKWREKVYASEWGLKDLLHNKDSKDSQALGEALEEVASTKEELARRKCALSREKFAQSVFRERFAQSLSNSKQHLRAESDHADFRLHSAVRVIEQSKRNYQVLSKRSEYVTHDSGFWDFFRHTPDILSSKLLKKKDVKELCKKLKWYRTIQKSGLFDAQFYASIHKDLAGYNGDLLLHYLCLGASEGRRPNSLFDGKWYTERYGIKNPREVNPLYHYITYGSARDFEPHPLFSASYYREISSLTGNDDVSLLEHYLKVGAQRGVSPHPLFIPHYYNSQLVERVEIAASLQHFVENWQIELADPNPLFDVRYYLGMNPDVSNAGAHPLMHFVVAGAAEMRDPSREFSMRGYYSLHADVEKSKTNALGHYLRFGIEEGRSACSVSSFKEKSDHRVFTIPSNLPRLVALEPSFDDFITLADRSHDEANTRGVRTDVIIPVYKGKAETLRCIYSVLKAKCETEFRLVVINDQSPDAELSESLRSLAKHNKFVLLENEQNVGFVASVNRGMNYSNNDILLLNSDTEVFPGWLDRIQAAAYSKESIGTVTPLSNSATICSYPNWCQDNSQVLELPPAGIDEICRTVNSSQYHEIPTAVGFCMYIKRECYRNVGEFDALKFGKGYCEENDFCLRASDKGWSHILTTDTYVLHYGGTSFGAEKNDRITKSLEIIRREYPYYESEVTRHIRVDPSLAARIQIDLERLDRVLLPRRFLFVSHTRGGGTTKHMTDMEQLLKKEGVSILYMESSDSGKIFIRTNSLASENIPNVCAVYLNSEPRLLADLILGLNIEHAHVHSLIDFEQAASGALRKSFEMADIKYDFTLHDYAPICPRVNLIDDSHKFCGGVAPKKCQQCVDRNNSSFGFVNVENWTASNKEFLRGARCVFGPSVDVIERTREQCPEANYVLRRHPEELPPLKTVRSQVSLVQKSSMRCIGIIGAVGIHKGSEILLACAKDAQARSLPLSFKIIGYSENQTSLAALPNVHWTGPYEEQDVFKLIRDEGLDIAWFPAVWPETFSYTLSVALLSGIVPVAFDLGAVAERLRLANTGALMPLSMMSDPSAINDYLCELELTPPLDEAVLKEQFLIYESCLKDYYNIFAQS